MEEAGSSHDQKSLSEMGSASNSISSFEPSLSQEQIELFTSENIKAVDEMHSKIMKKYEYILERLPQMMLFKYILREQISDSPIIRLQSPFVLGIDDLKKCSCSQASKLEDPNKYFDKWKDYYNQLENQKDKDYFTIICLPTYFGSFRTQHFCKLFYQFIEKLEGDMKFDVELSFILWDIIFIDQIHENLIQTQDFITAFSESVYSMHEYQQACLRDIINNGKLAAFIERFSNFLNGTWKYSPLLKQDVLTNIDESKLNLIEEKLHNEVYLPTLDEEFHVHKDYSQIVPLYSIKLYDQIKTDRVIPDLNEYKFALGMRRVPRAFDDDAGKNDKRPSFEILYTFGKEENILNQFIDAFDSEQFRVFYAITSQTVKSSGDFKKIAINLLKTTLKEVKIDIDLKNHILNDHEYINNEYKRLQHPNAKNAMATFVKDYILRLINDMKFPLFISLLNRNDKGELIPQIENSQITDSISWLVDMFLSNENGIGTKLLICQRINSLSEESKQNMISKYELNTKYDDIRNIKNSITEKIQNVIKPANEYFNVDNINVILDYMFNKDNSQWLKTYEKFTL